MNPSPAVLCTAVVASVAVLTACAPDPPSAVVGIDVEGCDPGIQHGSGAFVGDDIVLTSAHTLRGARTIAVTRGDTSVPATIVGFDPELDLAYLRVDLAGVRPLTVDGSVGDAGDAGAAWVVRDGEVVRLPITVQRRVNINTEDIYVDAPTRRPGFELEATIVPGDSGGPVVVDGKVIGVLWARSTRSATRAFAIDPDRGSTRIATQLDTGDLGDVDLMRCRSL